jgi:hypothetical protein
MSMVSKILTISGYEQLHFLVLISIIWLSFCCASIFAFGHQFQSLTTIGLASQMFFDAMLTMDTSQFYQQMAHAAYSPWVLQLFFWSWFIIVAVLLINIFLCIFVEAYCIIIADSRTATPMWTELYHVLQHDMRAIFLSKSKFMSDQRLLDILQEDPHQKANLPGHKELRALVIAQLVAPGAPRTTFNLSAQGKTQSLGSRARER